MGRFWIIRNIFKVHPFYYLAALSAGITGHFKGFVIFNLVILFHEAGHVIMALILGWKIEKIILLPFGALSVFKEDLNRKIIEEFWIVIMGPLFHLLFTYFFLKGDMFFYSLNLLLFNLLPIYPLDGSKILNLFLHKVISFKKSHLFVILISLFFIFGLIFFSEFNLIFVFILIFLLFKVLKEMKMHESLFNRFLLERYLKEYHFNKIRKIKGVNLSKMKRDYKHLFYFNNSYISEREVLRKTFDFKRNL